MHRGPMPAFELPRTDEDDIVGDADLGEAPVDAGEAPPERERYVITEREWGSTRSPFSPIDRDEVGSPTAIGHGARQLGPELHLTDG